ncbi:hypothetical protein ACIQKB_04080 [Streptomyces sp. NPDC092046]|uniref:hypothetical protein n=1 Tax=Streptomyces sp. NPDC092046 TaxID=3366009 RepID=UPI003804D5AB
MPKIRSEAGKTYDTSQMTEDEILQVAARLDDYANDTIAADQLTDELARRMKARGAKPSEFPSTWQ